MTKKLALLAALAALVVAFFAFGLDKYLTLAALKDSQASFAALRAESPIATAAAFFALYVLVTALSLPGAAIMMLTPTEN